MVKRELINKTVCWIRVLVKCGKFGSCAQFLWKPFEALEASFLAKLLAMMLMMKHLK